jgi:hemerythrin-like metal-binding protein
MGDVEWNEGMSVGVESLDQDHKILLLLINEINEAINNDSTHLLIKSIFEKLEKYIKEHFSKEEQLMQQCHYENLEEHKKEHQKFIRKIPELKKQLLNTESVEVAQNAYLFLVDWLMQHIIVDDMSYAQTIHDYGLATIKSPRKTFFQRVFAWIGKKVSLNKRLFFTVLVPISAY